MKTIKLIIILAVIVTIASCGKKDEKINTENQSSTQNVNPNTETKTTNPDVKKWLGTYAFEESAKNVTGEGAQSWNYVINVTERDANTVVAEIQIDGFQTMTRLEADVKAGKDNAEFVFSKYGKDNIFEIYKKGDRLFTFTMNDKNEIVTNWDKMKPNVIDNQKSGKVMFKKIAS